MFSLYQREIVGTKFQFTRQGERSLAGNQNGIIVQYLRTILNPTQKEPWKWEIDIDKAIPALKLPGNRLVINAKPNDKEKILCFDLRKIYGISGWEWTPILLELDDLIIDETKEKHPKFPDSFSFPVDKKRADTYNLNKERYYTYTFLHLQGWIKNRDFAGTWNWPGPSPTNSTFLWPAALEYFRKIMDRKLEDDSPVR